jgi:hypothetical protein
VSEGGYAYGRPPYGARADYRLLVKDAKEKEAIRLTRGLHTQGLSYRQIAARLEARG